MKKFALLIMPFLLFWAFSSANVAPPRVFVNEIVFDSLGNWTVEMLFYADNNLEAIDSIRLESSSGSSLLTQVTWIPYGDPEWPNWYAVIGDTNLASPVTIDPEGDYIQLDTYSYQIFYNEHFIAFGNYEGSYLDCLETGESYADLSNCPEYYFGSFTIDRTPTIGIPNDTTGCMSTLHGMVYDPGGEPITEGFFIMDPCQIDIQPNGSYTQRTCSRRYTCDEIAIRYPPWPYTIISYYIEPLDFCLRPDTSFQADFITTGYVNIDETHKNYDHALIISPNPFHSSLTFYLDADVLPGGENLLLIITDSHGKKVHESRLMAGDRRHDWVPGAGMPSGIYIYSLSGDNRVYTSGKVIKR